MGRLENKVAIITGGANGIGEASVRLFCKEGCKVALIDMDEKRGQAVADDITSSGQICKFWKLDVTDENAVSSVFKAVNEEFGKIDILFNNAAIGGANKKADECSVEDFQKVFDINVKGVFLGVKHVIPYMREQGKGSIINMSSTAGLQAVEKAMMPYHMSKGAVLSMSKNMAYGYAPDKIRVNALHPGVTKTNLTIEYGNTLPGGFPAYEEFMRESHPLGLGEPIDVAYAAVYLASDESKHCTGMSLLVDGGFSAK